MKRCVLLLALLCLAAVLPAQTPFSVPDALTKLYHQYDPKTKTAQWVCTRKQMSGPIVGWPCTKEDTTVEVSVDLMSQVTEGADTRIYLATNAEPSQDPDGFGCHLCAPAVGAAVFVWRGQRWELESSNVAIGFIGGYGGPPEASLVAVGPDKHGLLMWWGDEGQGFSSSYKELLLPIGNTVENAWSIEDENDNLDAVDSTDKQDPERPYRASAAFRFDYGDDTTSNDTGYYDIEVISRGEDGENYGHPFKSENWTEIYSFKDGKYRLRRRSVFRETKVAGQTGSD
jgi:hypothetical protein